MRWQRCEIGGHRMNNLAQFLADLVAKNVAAIFPDEPDRPMQESVTTSENDGDAVEKGVVPQKVTIITLPEQPLLALLEPRERLVFMAIIVFKIGWAIV